MMGNQWTTRSAPRWATWLVCAAAIFGSGCTRQFWRIQADREVYCLVDRASPKVHGSFDDFTIAVSPASRLFDPAPPDYPPMPPDDPVSHQLMHCVDCKQGFPCWHRNGDLPFVDYDIWTEYLPVNEDGVLVLDRTAAVLTALLNSRTYQAQLETLYLSALDVTFERFRFDTQFFGGNSTFFTADGPARAGGESSSVLNTDTDLLLQRQFASGGELVAGIANSFMWQFAGPDTDSVTTLLDFSLVQPLLRFGSRARVLETLTLSERVLLANIRQMERFRRGFYLDIVTGRDPGDGPSRRGGFFGGSGLQGFTGVGGGGFGRVGGGGIGGGGGGAGAAQAGGFMGLLQDWQQIANLEANVAGLRDSLEQLQASFDAGRIDQFQVGQARQALYEAQSQLLTAKAAYQTSLDGFKIDLGLPPSLEVEVDDPMLDRFNLIDPELFELQEDVASLLDNLRNLPEDPGLNQVEQYLDTARDVRQRAAGQVATVERDVATVQRNRLRRQESLAELSALPEIERGEVDPDVFNIDELTARVTKGQDDLRKLQTKFETTNAALERAIDQINTGSVAAGPARQQLLDLALELAEQLNDVLLIQARARLDSITIVEVDLDSETAMEIARINRRDLKNARASLVDTWRLIEFNANDLEADLNVVLEGDISNTENNPVRFRGTTGRLRAGLEFDAPLTRLDERNIYRQSLIEYQQARRQFMQFEDQISAGLRNILRTIDLNRVNLEIRRAAVVIAISQVEQARLRLGQPPQPGETTMLGSTTARDLVDALRQLNQAQNDFLSVWVNYEVQRMNLDFDLGTMQIDNRGLWIDPGPIEYPSIKDAEGYEDEFEEIEFCQTLVESDLPPAPEDMEEIPQALPISFEPPADGEAVVERAMAQTAIREESPAVLSLDALSTDEPPAVPRDRSPQPVTTRARGWQPSRAVRE